MRMLGLNQPKYVPPLNQAMAIETGSNLLSELIVVSIGVSLIILEFSRQARNDKLKHDKHKEQRQKLFSDLEALNDRVNEQVHEIQNLKVKLSQLSIRPVDE